MNATTHDEFLADEYISVAERIEKAVAGLPSSHQLNAREVDAILGYSDNSAMSVALLTTLSKAKREDAKAAMARVLRDRNNRR